MAAGGGGAAAPPDGAAPDPGARYAKTEAGRAEVRGRALALSRPARNLLLILEPGRPAEAWMGMVQGCGGDELRALLDAGLIAPAAAGAGPGAAAAAAPAAPARARIPLGQALARLGYRTLYERITALARPQLGLIKGYRLILELERCSGPDEARALALQFVEQVREADGDAAALALAERLAAPPPPDESGAQP